ncbi:hypothetical protein J1605_017789 [Eschrichtius robustus]|uniref:Pirin N-terminal domain-containing protein n=1 Tax=Eschrichtius robustus TaxID=9764 RepID=A0AB34I0M6_ESCRO|nr:hypothetical protein J1605_017789 [Eschrichtius robustus]
MASEDFCGHAGQLNTGDLQWMTMGWGIVHAEMPCSEESVHGLQLWVNLRSSQKMVEPWYQEVKSSEIPKPGSEVSGVINRELHSQAQERLQHYFMGRALEERAQQHREALTARINTNIEQLMKAPSLKEAEGKEPELFLSRSRPVAAKAKQAHLNTLKHIQAPWWKKLGEEARDEIDIPKDELSIELGTLLIGGTKPP